MQGGCSIIARCRLSQRATYNSVPRHPSSSPDMVAALVKGPEDENWILAEVVTFSTATGKYDVDDIDEEDKVRHLVTCTHHQSAL